MVRKEVKENMLKMIGESIIKQGNIKDNDSKAIEKKSEEFFNDIEKDGNKTIATISQILVNSHGENEKYVNDIEDNPVLAKLYAQNITIVDRVTAESEKIAQRSTKFVEERRELEEEKERIKQE